jgi:hypothetical protein
MTNNSSKKDIIEYTQDFWEPRLGYRPTPGEAEIMILNVTNLFKLLLELDAKDPDPIFLNPNNKAANPLENASALKGGNFND